MEVDINLISMHGSFAVFSQGSCYGNSRFFI